MTTEKKDEKPTPEDGKPNKNKGQDPYAVRNAIGQIGGVEAMKRYDAYIRDHRRRVRQLERIADGTAAPSDESYG